MVSDMSDRVQIEINIINIEFEYSDTDTDMVSDVEYTDSNRDRFELL